MEDFAAELRLSRAVFFKKIKSVTGSTPVDLLKEKRLTKAADLISTGSFSISEIAYMVGYSDPQYFSKAYKLYHKKTPSEFRECAKIK